MIIKINRESGTPMYQQIADSLRDNLLSGHFKHNDQLPSVRVLASMLEVNLHTVRHAYRILADEGVVIMGLGHRTRFCDLPCRETPATQLELEVIESDFRRLAFSAYMKGIDFQELQQIITNELKKLRAPL